MPIVSTDGGGDGNVMFDNIRLYAATCVPQFGPTADLDEDCDVDINDMDILANDWLQHADDFTSHAMQPAKAPILWYKFNESGQNVPADSGTGDANDYTGTITNFIAQNWKVGGGRDGNNCLYLPPGGRSSYVSSGSLIPHWALWVMLLILQPGGGGISFSVWINADMTADNMRSSWNGLLASWNGAVTTETLEIHCPGQFRPIDPMVLVATSSRGHRQRPLRQSTGRKATLADAGTTGHSSKEPYQYESLL